MSSTKFLLILCAVGLVLAIFWPKPRTYPAVASRSVASASSTTESTSQSSSSGSTEELNTYDAFQTNAFMHSCALHGSSWNQCSCVLNSFREKYTGSEFQTILDQASNGTVDAETKSWIEDVQARCSRE